MQPINENAFPIQKIWVTKHVIGMLISGLILLPMLISLKSFNNLFILVFMFFGSFSNLISALINIYMFKYDFGTNFVTLKQGFISKQQRDIPYSVIQTVSTKQGLFERLLGLKTLVFENASFGSGAGNVNIKNKNSATYGMVGYMDIVGFAGNGVAIPALQSQKAEELKLILLNKIVENNTSDGHSGL